MLCVAIVVEFVVVRLVGCYALRLYVCSSLSFTTPLPLLPLCVHLPPPVPRTRTAFPHAHCGSLRCRWLPYITVYYGYCLRSLCVVGSWFTAHTQFALVPRLRSLIYALPRCGYLWFVLVGSSRLTPFCRARVYARLPFYYALPTLPRIHCSIRYLRFTVAVVTLRYRCCCTYIPHLCAFVVAVYLPQLIRVTTVPATAHAVPLRYAFYCRRVCTLRAYVAGCAPGCPLFCPYATVATFCIVRARARVLARCSSGLRYPVVGSRTLFGWLRSLYVRFTPLPLVCGYTTPVITFCCWIMPVTTFVVTFRVTHLYCV